MNMNDMMDNNGNLAAYAWPGGYPVFYSTNEGVICPACANNNPEGIIGYGANWEDPDMLCTDCGTRIESAYADED